MMPPSTWEEAWELIDAMEAYYKETFKGFEEDDLFYEGLLDKLFKTPPGFNITIPTTARAIVDEAVDNATPSDVLVTYSPRGVDRAAEEDADMVRQWVRNLIRHWRTTGNDIDILRDFLKNLFKSGKAVFKVAPDWSLWPQLSDFALEEIKEAVGGDGEPYKLAVKERVALIEHIRAENVPVYCRSISPACIMEDPSVATRKLWIIERYDATPEDVRNTYSIDSEMLRERYATSFPVHEVWTATYIDWQGRLHKGWHYVFVNWELVRSEANPYDELPYIVKYSGFGREAYEGKPEYKSVGFFTRQNKSMLLAQMRRFSHLDAIMSQMAFPIAFLDQSAEMHDINFAPGAVNFVPERTMQNIQHLWVQPKIPDAEYMNSLGAISDQIERGTVQRVLRGAGVPGTDSAAQLGMISGQARLRVESCVQATEQALSLAASLSLKYVDTILKAKVSVFVAEDRTAKYTLGPENIRGRYVVDVRFQPNEEQIKERKLVLANDAIVKGGMSEYDAYVYAGFDNPLEMVARKQAYELLADPMIRRWLAKQTLIDWGLDADEIEMEARIEEGEKQFALREIMNQMALGTARDGMGIDPALSGGAPQEQQAPPKGQPGAGLMTPSVGAPAGMQSAPVQGLMQDIGALQSGV